MLGPLSRQCLHGSRSLCGLALAVARVRVPKGHAKVLEVLSGVAGVVGVVAGLASVFFYSCLFWLRLLRLV